MFEQPFLICQHGKYNKHKNMNQGSIGKISTKTGLVKQPHSIRYCRWTVTNGAYVTRKCDLCSLNSCEKKLRRIWWKDFLKTKGKTVELKILGIYCKTLKLACIPQTTVPPGCMPGKCVVQNTCHKKCDNDGRTKYVVELHHPKNQCEFKNGGNKCTS
jgi:hypothetical protein